MKMKTFIGSIVGSFNPTNTRTPPDTPLIFLAQCEYLPPDFYTGVLFISAPVFFTPSTET